MTRPPCHICGLCTQGCSKEKHQHDQLYKGFQSPKLHHLLLPRPYLAPAIALLDCRASRSAAGRPVPVTSLPTVTQKFRRLFFLPKISRYLPVDTPCVRALKLMVVVVKPSEKQPGSWCWRDHIAHACMAMDGLPEASMSVCKGCLMSGIRCLYNSQLF